MSFQLPTDIRTESDVEQKLLYPFFVAPNGLAIPEEAIRTKQYLAPTVIDKTGGKPGGYFPDYSIWFLGFPVGVVEAKDPSVPAETGFREAALYARHLNTRYPTGQNPCRYILASNGKRLLAGYWDQDAPEVDIDIADLVPEGSSTKKLNDFCGSQMLSQHASACFDKVKITRGVRPFNMSGGQPLLNAKLPLNSFAADLSPVLRRYFSSTNQDNVGEIARKAYVSSAETTEYDRVLEALLKDRVSAKRDTIVQPLRTSKNEEKLLTKAIEDHRNSKAGQLQIIQGGVGSGKSLFARRYRDVLEPQEAKERNFWSFIDFNGSPASLRGAESWLCERFVSSFQVENPSVDIFSTEALRGIFSHKIQQRKAYYEQMRSISQEEEIRARANDIANWQSNPVTFAEGIATYVGQIKNDHLIIVLDNVDKLDLQNQLDAFQLALWFLDRTKAFIIVQMRDETYERFKNKPPLDTFRAGIAFHISPPRFIDVVKRRLELGIEYLSANAKETQEYVLDNGVRVRLPVGEIGNFLKALYLLIFGRRTNVARVLEALAGRDVRKALEMFVSIVTSGHLSTSAITSNVRGAGDLPISEHHIIRILMRGDYRFFSDNTEYVSNIFHYDNDWVKPDNFILIEILYFLSMNRKRTGEIGLEGYFSVRRVCDELQKLGYDRDDLLSAVNYLLKRQLVIADHFNFTEVSRDDCVKIQASGFMHLRILCERIEYLYGVIPVIPVAEGATSAKLAEYINKENQRGTATALDKVKAVEVLLRFLKYEAARLREKNPFFDSARSGTTYVLSAIESAVQRYYNHAGKPQVQNELDLT